MLKKENRTAPKSNKDFFMQKKEWSEIKDTHLTCYLPQYFQKVLMTRRPIFYVDCFAGKSRFDDGKDGSPRIALSIRSDALRKTSAHNPRINTCFIDLHHASDLQANIADYLDCSPQVIWGKFECEIENLLTNESRNNVFLYIDPYGYQALDFSLFEKFAKMDFQSIELLINMNSFGLFRDACRVMKVTRQQSDDAFTNLGDIVEYDPIRIDSSTKSEILITSVCGGDYWKAIVEDYNARIINGYEAEERLSAEYRWQLKQNYNYVLDMPIRIPRFSANHACSSHILHCTCRVVRKIITIYKNHILKCLLHRQAHFVRMSITIFSPSCLSLILSVMLSQPLSSPIFGSFCFAGGV